MNVFYEEDGQFKVGSVFADNNTSLQVEAPHGKRSKIKAQAVLLRFDSPLGEFMTRAERIAEGIDLDFLWEASGENEFGYEELAREYFGRRASALESAGLLIRLHGAPMHFYKKGRGRYKPAPADALKAALASVERKRRESELQARYVRQLTEFELPQEFVPHLNALLYKPDRNAIENKALEAACEALHLSPLRLLEKCGAIRSSHDYHLNRFLFENFPRGTGFAPELQCGVPTELPIAEVQAFSIDDAATTEIDDAFSVVRLADGAWRVGIHIAAPALGVPHGSALDEAARDRLSTVYHPAGKITMFPEVVIDQFTLAEGRACAALSLYVTVASDTLAIVASETRVERVAIAANVRLDVLEAQFTEDTLADDGSEYPFKTELELLWRLACTLEGGRGKGSNKADNAAPERVEYNFRVDGERVSITPRRRGSPSDKVVSELMILANSHWGGLLAEHGIPALYRVQQAGKVRMSAHPAPHEGLGVAQYAWSSSPIRRYVDLVNQRQIIAHVRGEVAPYAKPADLFEVVRSFELAYDAYAEFQRGMERYWCLRYLQQENWSHATGRVIRENLVRFDELPLVVRIPDLPVLAPQTQVRMSVAAIDLLDVDLACRFEAVAADPEVRAAAAA
jgi:exoribonuclease-2